jgi:hypothetical protein
VPQSDSDLFFFGTLMDADVRDLVLGPEYSDYEVRRGWLRGFRRVFMPGRTYPMLLPHPHGSVEGILVRGLSVEAVRRLSTFEGPDYHLVSLEILGETGDKRRAGVFLSDRKVTRGRIFWSLPTWRRRYKRQTLRSFSRLMQNFATQVRLRPGLRRWSCGAPPSPLRLAGQPPGLAGRA